jgi:hypothetical protein
MEDRPGGHQGFAVSEVMRHQPLDGIAIQAYCALIASMLIRLRTERERSLRTYEMLRWYFLGWATEEELLAHLEKLKKQTAT